MRDTARLDVTDDRCKDVNWFMILPQSEWEDNTKMDVT
jgi:hypothetical protein